MIVKATQKDPSVAMSVFSGDLRAVPRKLRRKHFKLPRECEFSFFINVLALVICIES